MTLQELEISGRVVTVRPRGLGEFAVVVNAPPNLYWFSTDSPPQLGELLRITGDREPINESLIVLRDTRFAVVPESYTRRDVPDELRERVRSVARRSLYEFQVDGAAWIASRLLINRGAILGDDPGLGKSSQSICAVIAVQALPCLIVCPKTLRENWLVELDAVPQWKFVSAIVERSKELPRAHFVVSNYESMAGREREFSLAGFRSLIYDEAHAVKNPRGQGKHRAAVATRIANLIRRVVLLTGSPVPNGPEELWRLLHMTDPEAWGSFADFRHRYCTAHDGEKGAVRTSTGVLSRVQEFHSLVQPAFLRRLKSHVLELPPKRRRVVRVAMHPDDSAAYASAEADVRAWLQSLGAEAGSAKRERETLLKLATLRRIAALAKLRSAFPRYVEAWRKRVGRPLVVFGYHKSVVAGAAIAATDVGARVGVLSAATKPEDRQPIVDAFGRGVFDTLVCSLKVAGVGLNLQCASDLLFLERLWTPAMMDQAEDRCHRIGATREVVCSYFDAVDTIDEHIAYVLRSKRRIISHTIGDVHAERQAAQALLVERMRG